MRTRSRNPFTTVTTAGLLLPVDLLTRVVEGDPDLKGLSPKDYHLRSGERLNEAASRAWNECLTCWKQFRKKFDALPASDAGTTLTRDEWLLPLFQELGYGRLQSKRAIEIEDREYPISHGWENHVPIHLLSARLPLDRRTPGISGAATRAPYSLLQEQLNRSAKHRWGFVTNGLKLFLLRDNAALARAANVEFDLEAMMDGEHYADFMLMFLICHQSRVEIGEDGKPEDCWLEKWANTADQQGTRAREKLRDGVETAIKSLGAGFLTTKGNGDLRERLRTGELATQDYYRQLLRVVYRLLMLLVAEEKKTENGDNLLHPIDTTPEVRDRYARFYSVSRIRSLAYERRGTAHTDLYESLKVLFLKLRDGYEPLGIPGMGSFLFSDDSTPDLDDALLANQDLLDAFRNLCYTEDTSGRGGSFRRPVDFGNLGSEELGSVYESLLELHPKIETDDGPFTLGSAAGNERKTSGSYYTPSSLINCLLDSALDPVVHEAIDVRDPAEAEQRLLALRVCDPACGSGHFLIAASERMAMHLARVRTGDDQPNTLEVQHAKRDIIGRCIYGVDINPMSVELCKVSLWMEALEPGRALSFLDHHIQCGNSLLGTTPALLARGIPDDAFKPIEGDVKALASDLKKQNKKERKDREKGQGNFEFDPYIKLGNLPGEFTKLSGTSDDSVADVAEKERRYAELVSGADYQNARLLADTWCAVFVWQKDTSDLGKLCPTENDFRRIENNPHSILPHVKSEVRRLADQYQFFHWHLAFPDVFRLPVEGEAENEQTGWNAGFDVVLGNPPWETSEVKEKEWFAERAPEIANARNASARKKLIQLLEDSYPELLSEFNNAVRAASGAKQLIRSSARFPLCTSGKLNSYSLFTELNRNVVCGTGRVGVVVPSGITSEHANRHFFADTMSTKTLAEVIGFINERMLFPNVMHNVKYCILVLAGRNMQIERPTFVFNCFTVEESKEESRKFSLSAEDVALLNPNTRTCPVFFQGKSAAVTKAIYRRWPILQRDDGQLNHWDVDFFSIFNMSTDSNLFLASPEADSLPVYESKMIQQFTHRFATYEGLQGERVHMLPEVPAAVLADAYGNTVSHYHCKRIDVDARLEGRVGGEWLVAFRDVTSVHLARTSIFAVLPIVGAGHTLTMVGFSAADVSRMGLLVGDMNSFPHDFCTRQKTSGFHLSTYILKQVPVITPSSYSEKCSWSATAALADWILPRVLELTYTAWDLEAFALDCGYAGPPFCWDEERRFLLRCELDAAYFHLYLGPPAEWGTDSPQLREMFPTPRDAVDYIMETFPIVKRKDIKRTETQNEAGEVTAGTYITKDTILTIYDQMQQAIGTGEPYKTSLNPPPGPPVDEAGNFILATDWNQSIWPSHIHPRRKAEVP